MICARSTPPLNHLVDDDPYQSEIASYIAYDLGCDFESTGTGVEALEKVAERAPDVILLDVKMPDLSGYEICRRIKTDPATARTQVLFVTARTDEEDLLQGFEALANDYVTKPFSARELKARVKNALRAKDLDDALTARMTFLELEQEITEKLDEPANATDESRSSILVPILDRVASFFDVDGVTLHTRHPGRAETWSLVSTVWPGGVPPAYLAALALSEDPRVDRAPRMAGDRDGGADWKVTAAPLWVGNDLIGTLRLHQRGVVPAPGPSPELEHLVALAGHLARTIHRADLIDQLRTMTPV
jgi:CheY-like chemotaxis protein